MTELDVYQGRARRKCRVCGLEVEVEKPTRILSKTSNQSWRKKARQELSRQLLWQAMCDDCRAFWNLVLRAIESGEPRVESSPVEPTITVPEPPLEELNPASPRAIAIRAKREQDRRACGETANEQRRAARGRSDTEARGAE